MFVSIEYVDGSNQSLCSQSYKNTSSLSVYNISRILGIITGENLSARPFAIYTRASYDITLYHVVGVSSCLIYNSKRSMRLFNLLISRSI